MDSYIQFLCRFQKNKQKVPPPLTPPKEDFFSSLERVEGDFFIKQGSDGGGTWNFDIRSHQS